MANVFIMICWLSPIAALIGLIRPATFAAKGKTPPSRLKIVGLSLAVMLASLIAFGAAYEPTDTSLGQTASAPPITVATQEAPPHVVGGLDEEATRIIKTLVGEDFKVMIKGGTSGLSGLHAALFPYTKKVDAKALAKEYDTNEALADQEYKTKYLWVSGVVESINNDTLQGPFLLLKGVKANNPVHASMNKAEVNELATFKKGEGTELFCEGGGKLRTSALLSNCFSAKTAFLTVRDKQEKWLDAFFAGTLESPLKDEMRTVGQLYVLAESIPAISPCRRQWSTTCTKQFSAMQQARTSELDQRYAELASKYHWPALPDPENAAEAK